MINRKFRSVGWCAAVAVAALGGYLVSHRVAAERGDLEDVEGEIDRARAEILQLSTELGTRGRLSQLERWNRDVFALSAPGSRQYFEGAFDLVAHYGDERPAFVTPPQVLQASAPAPAREDAPVEMVEAAAPPAAREADVPRLQRATYVVPASDARAPRVERVAFLDAALAGEIAERADVEAAPAE